MKTGLFLACAIATVAIAGAGPLPAAAAPGHAAHATAKDWSAVVSRTTAGGFVMGNPDAKVKLVEYGSMTCPHCARFDENSIPTLTSKYVKTGKVSWEFRNYVRDAVDVSASLLARCGGPKAFFPLTRALFKEQANWEKKINDAPPSQLTRIEALPLDKRFLAIAKVTGFQQWGAAHGVPTGKSTRCLTDVDSANRLVRMTDDAKAQFPGFPGTPSFVVNDKMVELEAITEAEVWPALESRIQGGAGGARRRGPTRNRTIEQWSRRLMKPAIPLICAAALLSLAGCGSKQGNSADESAPVKLEQIKPPPGGDWTEVVNPTPAGGFVMGNPNAKVKLIEYGSMTCPHCKAFDDEGVPTLVDKYVKSGQVSWEFRNYVRDAFDVAASLVARCNGAKGFFPLTRAMYKDQQNWEKNIQAAPEAQLNSMQNLPTNSAVRGARQGRPLPGLGSRARGSGRQEQPMPLEREFDQPACSDGERRDEPVSRFSGHADLHHQRHHAR